MEGRIYVLISPSQPGYVKVGKTSRNGDQRALDLDSTALALPCAVAYEAVVTHYHIVELACHAALAEFRVRPEREWFKCSVAEAIAAIKQAIAQTEGAELIGEMRLKRAGIEPEPEPKLPTPEEKEEEEAWQRQIQWARQNSYADLPGILSRYSRWKSGLAPEDRPRRCKCLSCGKTAFSIEGHRAECGHCGFNWAR